PRSSAGPSTGSAAVPDGLDQLGDLVVDLATLLHEVRHLLHRVDDRRVVAAAELPGDGRVREVGQLPEHVHGDLAGDDQGAAAALAPDLLDREPEHGAGGVEDGLGGDGARLAVA